MLLTRKRRLGEMGPLPVLIVAHNNDLHARAVFDALLRRQVAVEWVDFASLNKDIRLTLMLNDIVEARLITLSGRTITFSEVHTVWWRRPRRPDDDLALDEETRAFVRGEWE